MTNEVQVLAVGLVSALGVGLLGVLASYLARHRSLRWQLIVLVLTSTLAVFAGVLALAQQQFLTSRGLEVVALVCLVAVLVSVGIALLLAHWVTRWSDLLRVGLRRVGRGASYAAEGRWPAELYAVATELEETRRRLDQVRARERQVEQSRRDLISWLAHDLQGPLLRLRTSLEPDPLLTADIAAMSRIVDDLAELSRQHSGALHLDPQELAVEELVTEAVTATRPAAQERGVRVSTTVDPGLRLWVDPVAMTRVLVHLVDQSLGHAPVGGVVRVRARGVDGQVEIVLTDGCADVPLDDRSPAAANGPDLGPALTIVTGILEAHQGSLEIDVVAGPGASRGGGRAGCRYVVRVPPQGVGQEP